MNTETRVAAHYTKGHLEASILRALSQSDKDPTSLTAADLAPLDEFHVGGLESTQRLAAQLELERGLRLLDVGSGLGGPARYLAGEYGCHVTGIDLTEEFVEVSKSLTRLLKLESAVVFRQASALDLPFEAASFDGAYMFHVGMNLPDKSSVFREVRRVLKPGSLFGIFDFMRLRDGAIRYPVPWALSEETSFVAGAQQYRDLLEETGFEVTHQRSQRAFAIEFTSRAMAVMAKSGPPVLGIQLLLGEKAPGMAANMLAMMEEGVLEPVELVARVK